MILLKSRARVFQDFQGMTPEEQYHVLSSLGRGVLISDGYGYKDDVIGKLLREGWLKKVAGEFYPTMTTKRLLKTLSGPKATEALNLLRHRLEPIKECRSIDEHVEI